ncbi:MAG: imidazolonepropionase [Candidatus Polarisedimenticolia bacterium]
MIEADLAVVDADELVTVRGPAPKTGEALRDPGILHGGCVAARDGVLVFVGEAREYRHRVRLARSGEEIDAAGRIVLPGFVDPHTHLPFAGWRADEFVERLAGATWESIAARGGGIMATVRATRAASFEDLVASGKRHLDVMLRHGTTTAEAKSGYGLTQDDELKLLRVIRALGALHPIDLVPTFLGAHVVPPERRDDREGYLRELIDRSIPQVAREGLARFCDVFVEEGAFSAAEGERVLGAAAAAGLGLRVHAEQRSASGGALLAARLRAASADHLEHAGDAAIGALAAAGTTAVLLPGAAFFLRDPRDPPVRRMIEAGVPIALATDFNPGTCPLEAMTAILPLACLRYGLDPAEAIAAATLNAAHSLGIAAHAGSLEVGKAADLLVAEVPDHRHLAYRFGVNPVRTVIKAGRVVVRDGIVP